MRIVQVCIDQFLDLLTRCVQERAVAQNLWLLHSALPSGTGAMVAGNCQSETLHVDAARSHAA